MWGRRRFLRSLGDLHQPGLDAFFDILFKLSAFVVRELL